jgi:hypothetical protein
LPGQNVFTCLSHDIVAHETTHALVDRLRRYFMEPSNEDVLAELLRAQIESTRGDIRDKGHLVELAQQFGYATGTGKALRSVLDDPSAKLYQTVTEPHERGSILVAAVFDRSSILISAASRT